MVRYFLLATELVSLLAACGQVAAQANETEEPGTFDSDSLGADASTWGGPGPQGCSALSNAGLGSLLLYPSDAAYAAREASYWAPTARLGPQCIVQPRTTSDVSKVVKTLSDSCTNFAVRSGGHVQWGGGSDVKNGVTVDLGLMTAVTYNKQTSTVSIQPGPRWRDVYSALEPYGVTVTGGRDADVGIGGFLTGGGNSFYTGRTGFGCDTIVNFEVVLASGAVVNANKTSNADLHKALKGGWSNFGIVTRFDVESIPGGTLWGGMAIHNKSAAGQVATALANFNDQNNLHREDAHLAIATYNSVVPGDTAVLTVIVDTNNVENAPAFAEIQQIPSIAQDISHRSLGAITEAYKDPGGKPVIWFTLTFKNDVAIINKAISLHDELVTSLKSAIGATAFASQCVLQPIPSYFGAIGATKGGSVLGLDFVKTNSIQWLGTVAFPDVANYNVVQAKLSAYSASLESFAKSRKGNVAWRYINYSDKTQNPLRSYGAANFNFMQKVAAKYDPNRVFQRQVPGSFKLSVA